MIFRRNAIKFFATGCFIGRSPIAPGTFGSLIGLPVIYVLSGLPWHMAFVGIALLIAGAVWVSGEAERFYDVKDPGCIVIDEIAGMAVSLYAIPLSIGTGLAGFLLFRFFDITKLPPIRQLEQRLSGGWGIVMDDIAAGVMANLVLRLGLFLVSSL